MRSCGPLGLQLGFFYDSVFLDTWAIPVRKNAIGHDKSHKRDTTYYGADGAKNASHHKFIKPHTRRSFSVGLTTLPALYLSITATLHC